MSPTPSNKLPEATEINASNARGKKNVIDLLDETVDEAVSQ